MHFATHYVEPSDNSTNHLVIKAMTHFPTQYDCCIGSGHIIGCHKMLTSLALF